MTENQPSDTERLAVLEEQAAHQQNAVDELSDQLAEQWKIVEQLRGKIERMAERFATLEANALDAPPNIRPPHY